MPIIFVRIGSMTRPYPGADSSIEANPPSHATKTLRVAVADDEPLIRTFVEDTLSSLGHEIVVSAGNGVELLEGFRDGSPDLIVTDIHMPVQDGVDAVREICKERTLPVVFMTGFAERGKVAAYPGECGVFVYLVKPVGSVKLQIGIDMVMARFRQFRAVQAQETDAAVAMKSWQMLEEAKAVLMARLPLDENEAFAFIQREAIDNGQRLVQAAERLLSKREA